MNIMAIDPGKSGGVYMQWYKTPYISTSKFRIPVHCLRKLPYTDDGRPDIDWLQANIIHHKIDFMVIERQQARSRQAHQLSIGIGYGMLLATAVLCGVEVVELRPQEWQGELGLSGDKQEHIDYAEAAGFDIPWTSYKKDGEPMMRATKHDGMADAVCIARAYMRMVKND